MDNVTDFVMFRFRNVEGSPNLFFQIFSYFVLFFCLEDCFQTQNNSLNTHT